MKKRTLAQHCLWLCACILLLGWRAAWLQEFGLCMILISVLITLCFWCLPRRVAEVPLAHPLTDLFCSAWSDDQQLAVNVPARCQRGVIDIAQTPHQTAAMLQQCFDRLSNMFAAKTVSSGRSQRNVNRGSAVMLTIQRMSYEFGQHYQTASAF